MDKIKSLNTYKTDTYNSMGICNNIVSIDKGFEEVLKICIDKKAMLIVKPSCGKYWYIKGINDKKSYSEIKSHLESNVNTGYKKRSNTWLLSYN